MLFTVPGSAVHTIGAVCAVFTGTDFAGAAGTIMGTDILEGTLDFFVAVGFALLVVVLFEGFFVDVFFVVCVILFTGCAGTFVLVFNFVLMIVSFRAVSFCTVAFFDGLAIEGVCFVCVFVLFCFFVNR